ncbi:MAG: amidohydrolase family protein [Candidatus Sumerlaeaceae bacterium]|jgi:cytosine/adenosine deaminase-related metal-dependent hydrolase
MRQFIKSRSVWVEGTHLRYNAVLCIENGIVADILSEHQINLDASVVPVLEEEILLPGFINSHAHIEYSFCRGKLPRGPVSFAQWIEAIGELKRNATQTDVVEAAREAMRELAAGGATTVIDCAHRREMTALWGESRLRHVILWELIALFDEQADAVWKNVELQLNAPRVPHCIAVGLNPHAPYSVGARLREHLRAHAAAHPDTPIGWHLAETDEEMRFFQTGLGPFRDFCTRHQLPTAFDEMPACSPTAFLAREGLLESADLLFHFNHFSREDVNLLSRHQTIVYCPTTHRYFARPSFDLYTLHRAGVPVALGTDSLATSDTLSMLDTLRMASENFPSLTGSQLLAMVTTIPARSTFLRSVKPPIGTIARGAAADFTALATDLPLDCDLREILIHPSTKVMATYVGGVKVY